MSNFANYNLVVKLKCLSIAFSLVVALILVSCGSSTGTKNAEPTGEPQRDAKASMDAILDVILSVETEEDYDNFRSKIDGIKERFKKYYDNLGEEKYHEFFEEVHKLENDPEYVRAFEKAEEHLQQKEAQYKERG